MRTNEAFGQNLLQSIQFGLIQIRWALHFDRRAIQGLSTARWNAVFLVRKKESGAKPPHSKGRCLLFRLFQPSASGLKDGYNRASVRSCFPNFEPVVPGRIRPNRDAAFNSMNLELTAKSQAGEPTWEVAQLFPVQGQWQEADFFELHSNRMVELVAGRLEVLPMPTWLHQLIVRYLFQQLSSFITSTVGGSVLFAPLPVRLFPGTIREPDVLYVAQENTPQNKNGYPERVDLVMEVVSDSQEARTRDYEEKRNDYARGGVAEYWIVDYQLARITVLTLVGGAYQDAGVYTTGQSARSILIPGFAVEIDRIIELGRNEGN